MGGGGGGGATTSETDTASTAASNRNTAAVAVKKRQSPPGVICEEKYAVTGKWFSKRPNAAMCRKAAGLRNAAKCIWWQRPCPGVGFVVYPREQQSCCWVCTSKKLRRSEKGELRPSKIAGAQLFWINGDGPGDYHKNP